MISDDAAAGMDHAHPVDRQRVAEAWARLLSADDAARLAALLSLMAEPVRSRILYALEGDVTLAPAPFDFSPRLHPALSAPFDGTGPESWPASSMDRSL